MLISFIRTAILYLALILAIRLMGKRQLGQMEPTEFVVTLLIADLASVPMQNEGIPLLSGLIPILVVLSIELILSVTVWFSVPMRRLFCGKPVILLENGKLLHQNLRKTRVSSDELTAHLRLQGYADLSQIRYAILETSGSISVLPDPACAPASAKDAGVKAAPLHLPVTLITQGRIMEKNLSAAGRSRAWVEEQVKKRNCRLEDVFLMTADRTGKVYLSVCGRSE